MPHSAIRRGLFRRGARPLRAAAHGLLNEALAALTARGMIAHPLHESANFLTEKCNPPGCLLVRARAVVQRGCGLYCRRACSPAHRW